jgi:hypothetical protein
MRHGAPPLVVRLAIQTVDGISANLFGGIRGMITFFTLLLLAEN